MTVLAARRLDHPPPALSEPSMSADESPEGALVDRARDGDVAAFEALYHANVDRIHGLCLRMVGDRALAEDLTQEAFVRAWEKLSTFRGTSAFSTWLYRLAVNTVLSNRRSKKRRPEQPLEVVEPTASAPPEARPGHRIDLERALLELTPQARLVFLLYDAHGFRHAEIAELVGISEGTSKVHLHRARKRLRKALRP